MKLLACAALFLAATAAAQTFSGSAALDEAIDAAIHPQGVAVVMEAEHLCMMMRGVEKQHSQTVTSAMLGVFKTQPQTRTEFLSLVNPDR